MDLRGRNADFPDRFGELLEGTVEIGLERTIGFGKVFLDAIGEVLRGDVVQGIAEACENGAGFRLRFPLERCTRLRGLLAIDGDRHVHVEHHGLQYARDDRSHLVGLLFRPREEAARRPVLADDGADQVLEEERIAADVPFRLETDPRMHRTDGAHLFGIGVAEIGGGDMAPVLHLHALGVLHVVVGSKELPEFRRLLDLHVEPVQPLRQFTVDHGLEAAQVVAVRLVETDEGPAFVDIVLAGRRH